MRWLNTDVDIVDAECDLDAECADDPRSPPPRPHPPASQTSCSKSNWSRLWSGSRTLYAASAAPVRAVPSCLLQAAAAQGRIGSGVGQATCPVSSKAHHPPPTAARLHRHPHRRRQRHQARRRPGRVRPPAGEEWRHLRWSHAADVKEQKGKQMPDIKETFDRFICRHM